MGVRRCRRRSIPSGRSSVPPSWRSLGAAQLLRDNLMLYGVGGLIVPFIGIKLMDVLLTSPGLV
ncbi:MAG: hypothetical protein EPN21_03900 [Methylococcaceae bacterium]|nr:MAG: hypothetical protein EPN21_03900 [Methylococcaceae bacterium]